MEYNKFRCRELVTKGLELAKKKDDPETINFILDICAACGCEILGFSESLLLGNKLLKEN